jgi:hypothetical protein
VAPPPISRSGQGGQELRTYLRLDLNGLTEPVATATLRSRRDDVPSARGDAAAGYT